VAPDLPVHASTQMSLHSLDGVKAAADLGITRAVLARELSGRDIAYICEHSPIEIETFVHGALCMCHSGQCYMSSVIGGRSGNRGLCAQPCRLAYGWGDKADSYPLSLKDASMADHLQEFQRMGVASVKIEGRMKRPEYVWVVTKIYADALREGRDPTKEELRRLADAFSRQGFTDGYFRGETGADMFGVRENTPEPRELFAEARAAYEKGEGPGVSVKFYAMVRAGEPVQVGVEDGEGRIATAAGDTPEVARTRAVTQADVESQLSKTGGTPFRCTEVRSLVEEGLSVPLSALNKLRRDVLEELSRQRTALPQRQVNPYKEGARYDNPRTPPVINVSLRKASQLSPELIRRKPNLIYLPTDEIAANPDRVKIALDAGLPVAATLPRVCFDREMPELRRQLEVCRELGITEALTGNIGLARTARELGFDLRGDFGLQVFNSQACKEYKRQGFKSLTASFELKLAQIRDLAKVVDTELIAYGRLPLMITENCIIHNHTGKHTCANVNLLTDRRGVRFPVVKAWGCRNEILNANKLYLADKEKDYSRVGAWAIRLSFTTENAQECVRVLEHYMGQGSYVPSDFTRGLYYRDVE
ncbi:MAG: U32 family peptidase, partial [Oscillospiraceae bacterium]|nr:U32 family peptidase [Oscillospiraceae bacterium]